MSNPREILAWRKRRFEETLRRRELLRQGDRLLTPNPLPESGPSQIHMLIGHRTVAECLWALHSFLTYAEPSFPVCVHDDGSLIPRDCQLLERFYPGIRVLRRQESDAEVVPLLKKAGLNRLSALRAELPFTLKLLDLQHFAQGRRVLYLDTDILFFQRPTLLLDLMRAGTQDSTAWYNLDRATWYTWTSDDLYAHTGIRPGPQINAGLFTARIDDLSWWARYEDWLGIARPQAGQWTQWHREQTLWALHLTAIGAKPLPAADYDVHHRSGWAGMDAAAALRKRNHGAPVVSQHYSGTWDYRQMFYDALRTRFFAQAAARARHSPAERGI